MAKDEVASSGARAAIVPPKNIVAVALGPNRDKDINSANDASDVRPYVAGLITGLAARNKTIGTTADYVIKFRQRPESDLTDPATFTIAGNQPDAIFCMSTSVAWAAANFSSTIPIVAVVSDPSGSGVDADNICGVSGKRTQFADKYLDRFISSVPSLTKVYLLHKQGYSPALDGLRKIQEGETAVDIELVNVRGPGQIANKINAMTSNVQGQPVTNGILVLPADLFFGAAAQIASLAHAKRLPDFWPVTDNVLADGSGTFGGWGVPQNKCGQMMGAQFPDIWAGAVTYPKPRFDRVVPKDFVWRVSSAVAQACGATLGSDPRMKVVP